ncbi:lipase class 3 family protein [Amanita muscaria]
MISVVNLLAALLVSTLAVQAVPFERRQSINSLSTPQISAFTPLSHFAAAAYCQPDVTRLWTCGADCQANADFIPVAAGGDGASVQFWYVGFSPSLNSVIVAHQGTDTTKIQAIATDVNAFQESLDSNLFPGIDSSVEVHNGFANEQAKTATQVLSAAKSALSTHGATSVTVVGHSLGAAIALLDSVYLPLHLPGVSFTTVTYGMPRVGNQAFANYVDSHLKLTHVNNKKDPIPIVPGRFLGYHHPSGEVHITTTGPWESCPGQDNTNSLCTVGDVPNIFESTPSDHHGPYNGINMSC